MWPKVIAQLIELLPHVTRLVPMADRFLQSRAGNDDATRESMDKLQAELGRTISAQESVYRQINEQGERIDTALGEVRSARAAVEASAARLAGVEAKVGSLRGLLVGTVVLNVVLIALVIALLVRH
ncbi:MAG: hypothetical protein PW792_01315 [Acidobacteriaceae bacterium]|nr:hypothetical protein [Acidobacteriaceae bacterium]